MLGAGVGAAEERTAGDAREARRGRVEARERLGAVGRDGQGGGGRRGLGGPRVALVASGFGVCLVPESATTLRLPGVTYRPLRDVPPNGVVDLSCIYRADDQSPLLAAFLETVRIFREQKGS